MNDVQIRKNAGFIFSLKEELDGLASNIKTLEKELDEGLQESLMKSSNLVDVNKNLAEIKLISQTLQDTIKDDRACNNEILLKTLFAKIYEIQNLLAKEIQKSMLKAAEAIIEAQRGLILIGNMSELVKSYEKIHWKMRSGI